MPCIESNSSRYSINGIPGRVLSRRRTGLGSGVQFPSGPWEEGRLWGDEGRSQKTGEQATVLVQVSDDGDWTRIGAIGVEKSRHIVDLAPTYHIYLLLNCGLPISAQTLQSVREHLLSSYFALGRAPDYEM